MMRKVWLLAVCPLALSACDSPDPQDEPVIEEGQVVEQPAEGPGFGDAEEEAAASEAQIAADSAEKEAAEDIFAEDRSKGRCKITAVVPGTLYEGPCDYVALGGGSFFVETANPEGFVDGHTQFIIEADTHNSGGLSVRTPEEELVSVGTANHDGPCWTNDSYDVCAYAQ